MIATVGKFLDSVSICGLALLGFKRVGCDFADSLRQVDFAGRKRVVQLRSLESYADDVRGGAHSRTYEFLRGWNTDCVCDLMTSFYRLTGKTDC